MRFSGPIRSVTNPNHVSANATVGNAFISQSGTLGSVSSPPTDALIIEATANAAAANTVTLTNASFGQASTITIPDPGAATANVMLSNNVNTGLSFASATFTAAQMATAYATPLMLVPAPAAGLCVIVLAAQVAVNSTGNTALATGTAPIIQYSSGGTNGAHGAGTIATASGLVAGDITASTSQVRNLLQMATGAQTGLSGLGISFSNATGAYTAGTGTTVSISLTYVVVPSNN